MPEAKIAARGGAIRWRTVKTKNGDTIRVAVVRRKGPKGGRTVAGPVHKGGSNGKGRTSSKAH